MSMKNDQICKSSVGMYCFQSHLFTASYRFYLISSFVFNISATWYQCRKWITLLSKHFYRLKKPILFSSKLLSPSKESFYEKHLSRKIQIENSSISFGKRNEFHYLGSKHKSAVVYSRISFGSCSHKSVFLHESIFEIAKELSLKTSAQCSTLGIHWNRLQAH